ncbi:hypothetical protein KA531_02825 [Candidatus Saccharibacteria bacterium]|nr:hypothetical protein [Candidatus Saccharibacteria bacterium]
MVNKLKGLMILLVVGFLFGFGISQAEAAEVTTSVDLTPLSNSELGTLGIPCVDDAIDCVEVPSGSFDSNVTGNTTFFGYRLSADICADSADLISATSSLIVSGSLPNLIDEDGVLMMMGDSSGPALLSNFSVSSGNLYEFGGVSAISRGINSTFLGIGEIPVLDEGLIEGEFNLMGYTFGDLSNLIVLVEHDLSDGLLNGAVTSYPTVTITYDDSACPSVGTDTDGDGISDDQEMTDGTDYMDPCSPNPYALPDGDCDDDGLTNGQEDTNGNGLYDQGSETDPTNPDTDEDGVVDGEDSAPLDRCLPDTTQCDEDNTTPVTTLPKAGIPVAIFSVVASAIILSVYKLRKSSLS